MRRARPGVALVGGLVGLAGAAWYLSRPGRSVTTAAADLEALVSGTLKLSDQQRAMINLIGSEFSKAGLDFLTLAACANAYAESRLDPMAVGDSGHSIGLFQCYDQGAGKGYTVEQRQDPVTNCAIIIAAARSSGILELSNLTNTQWASEFARLVEVCSACDVGGSEYVGRGALVAQLFGADVAAQIPR